MDPFGNHLIICSVLGDCYYARVGWERAKVLLKWRGMAPISSCCWEGLSLENGTGKILLGSINGSIYEAEIVCSDGSKIDEKLFRNVWSISQKGPITGIYFQTFPSVRSKYLVMISTCNSLLHFIGNYGSEGFLDVIKAYHDLPGNAALERFV